MIHRDGRPGWLTGAALPVGAAAARAASNFDWSAVLVALVGAAAIVTAAALARGARQRERGTRGDPTDEVLTEWHRLVTDIRAERDRAVAERDQVLARLDRMAGRVETALAERDLAQLELRACREAQAAGT